LEAKQLDSGEQYGSYHDHKQQIHDDGHPGPCREGAIGDLMLIQFSPQEAVGVGFF
jgi:hypothetical protein